MLPPFAAARRPAAHRSRVALLALGLVFLVALLAAAPRFAGPADAATLAPPHSLRLMFGDDAATEMHVAWGTDANVPQSVKLWRAGEIPRLVPSERHGWPESRWRDADGTMHVVPGEGTVHVARIGELAPGATYRYQVGSGATGWSTTHTFRTAPLAFPGGEVVFTAFADSATALQNPNVVGAALVDPHFHLHMGDLSYADVIHPEMEREWRAWFLESEPLLAEGAYMPAFGNHEWDVAGTYYQDLHGLRGPYWYHTRIFPLQDPAIDPMWSFRYGDVAVVGASFAHERSPFDAWAVEALDRELAKHAGPDVRWRLVTMHAGPYGTGSNHGSNCAHRAALEDVLARHGVDLVLSGHEHNYERTYPIRSGATVVDPDGVYPKGAGVAYVVAGTGGPHDTYGFRAVGDSCSGGAPVDYSAYRSEERVHLRLTETAKGLRVEAFLGEAPVPVDGFTIAA